MRFSEYYKLNRTQPYLDFVDIPLHTDVAVFLDPTSIKLLDSVWGNELSSLLQTFFDVVLRLIKEGNNDKAIKLLSSLNESNEFHLGYSTGESRGHGFGKLSAETVWNALTKSKAAKTGLLKDLEDTVLLIPGIGTDMISDAVCNILRGPLIKYTQDMCLFYNIPLTPDTFSGPIWNPIKEKWESELVPLPVTDRGMVILIPKILVRHNIRYQYDNYYRHYLLPEMQNEHLLANSPLVETLKNKNRRVTKKDLMAKYGTDKLSIIRETIKRPKVLEEFRREVMSSTSLPLTHKDFSEVEGTERPNLKALITNLKNLSTGKEKAIEYEDIIEKILSVILYPSLCNPKKQYDLHDRRKRVDITYTNEAKNGFFSWLSQHYPCPLIFIECKNYGKDIANPEIDQLSGRFSPSRGKVGLLICREIKNKKLMYKRCIDTAKDRRGFILVLDDNDIELLVNEYIETNGTQDFPLLRELWNSLIN